jgi:hypothetical protein
MPSIRLKKFRVIIFRLFLFIQFICPNLLVGMKSYSFSLRKCTFFGRRKYLKSGAQYKNIDENDERDVESENTGRRPWSFHIV